MAPQDPPLPPGWEKILDPQSERYYYVNHELKVRSWMNPGATEGNHVASPPAEVTPAPAAPAPAPAPAAPQQVAPATEPLHYRQPPPQQARVPSGGATRVDVIGVGPRLLWVPGQTALTAAQMDITGRLSPQSAARLSPRRAVPAAPVFVDGRSRSRSPPVAPRGGSTPPKSLLEQHVEHELSVNQGRRTDGMQDLPSPTVTRRVLGEGGGRRLVDRRKEAKPWQRSRNLADTPLYASSPGVLQTRSKRAPPLLSGDLHASQRSVPEPAGRPLTYTEQLTGQQERRASPADKALQAMYDQQPHAALSRSFDARGAAGLRSFANAPLSQSVDMRSSLLARPMDNPSLSSSLRSTSVRGRGSQIQQDVQSLRNNYGRFENFVADSVRHGSARAEELNRLSSFSHIQQFDMRRQSALLEDITAAYRFSQAQHDDLRVRFQMLMADNQYLIEQVRSKQYAHPTVPNTNGAIAVPGTRPSVDEFEGLVRVFAYFQEQLQQAQAMAMQERQRSNFLANELLGLQMQQGNVSVDIDTREDERRVKMPSPARPVFRTSTAVPQEVPAEMLIDQYLGVYEDFGSRAAPNGVGPVQFQYEKGYANGDNRPSGDEDGMGISSATVGAISIESELVGRTDAEDSSSVEVSSADPLTSQDTSRTPSASHMQSQHSWEQNAMVGDFGGAGNVDGSGPSLFGEPLFKRN